MPTKKTVYIVGAGASSEAGLPTGQELKHNIARSLDIRYEDGHSRSSGDRAIDQAIRMHVSNQSEGRGDINPHLHACWRIRDAMPQAISIDNFIDAHSDDEKIEFCGKLAIVKTILDAERKSLLYIDRSNTNNKINYKVLENTWYASFIKLLTENCKADELVKRFKSISLIIFNYDRCIEHFIFNSLQNYYGLTPDKSAEIISELDIYHPYGVIGNLPWQGGRCIEFGEEVHPSHLLEFSVQIKTFTEGTDPDSSEIKAIRNKMNRADIIVFLGFAYHKLNVQLLLPSTFFGNSINASSYFGTAKGISNSDCKIIIKSLEKFNDLEDVDININNNLDCSMLFNEYWRSLSLSDG